MPPPKGRASGSRNSDSSLPKPPDTLEVELPSDIGRLRRFNIFDEARAAVDGKGKGDLPPPSLPAEPAVDKVLGCRVRVAHEGRRTRNKLEANGNWAAGVVDITEDDDPVSTVPLVLERLGNRGSRSIS